MNNIEFLIFETTTLKARGKSQITKPPPPVLCQKTRGNPRSIKRENNALFFVKGWEKTESLLSIKGEDSKNKLNN